METARPVLTFDEAQNSFMTRESKSLPKFEIEDDTPASADDKFRERWGRPADPDRQTEWEASPLPKAAHQRRRAARHLLAIYGARCGLCGLAIDPELEFDHSHPARVTLDHIEPISRGGSDTWGNVRAAHRSCNAERRDERVPLDARWLQTILQAEVEQHAGNRTAASVAVLRLEYYAEALAKVMAEIEAEKSAERPDRDRIDALLAFPFEYRMLVGEWTARARIATTSG